MQRTISRFTNLYPVWTIAVSVLALANPGLLAAAALLLHVLGFGLGYGAARLFGYPLSIARTLSIEVGMQNGGLAAALARNNISSMSLAAVPAVFSALIQTLVGSVIATWWRMHPS